VGMTNSQTGPETQAGKRLFYEGISVDPPRVVSRVTPSLNEICGIEAEARQQERERLRLAAIDLIEDDTFCIPLDDFRHLFDDPSDD